MHYDRSIISSSDSMCWTRIRAINKTEITMKNMNMNLIAHTLGVAIRILFNMYKRFHKRKEYTISTLIIEDLLYQRNRRKSWKISSIDVISTNHEGLLYHDLLYQAFQDDKGTIDQIKAKFWDLYVCISPSLFWQFGDLWVSRLRFYVLWRGGDVTFESFMCLQWNHSSTDWIIERWYKFIDINLNLSYSYKKHDHTCCYIVMISNYLWNSAVISYNING